MKKLVRAAYEIFTDSLYPRRCPVCDEVLPWDGSLFASDKSPQFGKYTAGLVCPGCMEKLSFVKPPLCAKCGKQLLLASQVLCADCSQHPRSYERGLSVLNYEEYASASMIRIKYGKRREYARFYGRLIAERLSDEIRKMNPQCIIPVPVHPDRFVERGYDQAELIAKELAACMGIPLKKGVLVRIKKTIVQKELGAEERLQNLSEAFGVLCDNLSYNRVLLVDDIYTTGSTVEACTRVLTAAGVKKVYFVTVCTGSDR